MKKYFTATAITIIFFAVRLQAQVLYKGDKLFGGSFSFSVFYINNNNPGYSNSGNVALLPAIGWAIKNDLVAGVKGSVNYSHSKSPYNVSDKRITNSFTLGPVIYLKKYKLLKNKFGLYFDHSINGSYYMSNEKIISTTTVNNKSHGWGVEYNFSPGVFYKLSENFFGEVNIGGLYTSYVSYGPGNNSTFGVGASFLQYFNLGINYRIARKNNKI